MAASPAPAVASRPADALQALSLIADAQHKLSQLESTAKGVLDELSAAGPQATPRLRELLAAGDQLVAGIQANGTQLARGLPAGIGSAPQRGDVEAVWARQLQPQQAPAAVVPTPATRPATSLQELAVSLAALPGCSLQLHTGRQPATAPGEATAALLRCGRAFAAVVHLQQPGGLLPLRVGVLSAAEAEAALGSGSARAVGGSLWALSQHTVFRQLAAQAAGALEHFLQQQQAAEGQAGAASPLECLLLWLVSCGDLFSPRGTDGSSGSGLLLADPATSAGQVLSLRRPFRQSWERLWAAAVNPQLRQAEPAG